MSSKFGPTKPLPAIYGSLGLPTTSEPPSDDLGSIFMNFGRSKPQQQPQTTQPGGLFSNLGSSSAQQNDPIYNNFEGQSKPSGSIINPFLSSASTLVEKTTTSGGGLGIPGPSQAPGLQPQQTSQPFGASLFAQGQPLQGQSQEQAGKQSLGTGRGPQLVYFDNLLEKGKKKANGSDGELGFGELPSLQLGLGDIAKRARELGGATADSKASARGSFHLAS